ncbi:MAG: RsmG family class I SAM-dependent methyltransferase [Bacteriovoracaceae bacterium]
MLDRKFSDDLFNIYFGELEGLNLTAIRDPDDFYQKQVLDSIYPYEQSDIFRGSIGAHEYYLDVGFGGGFPLLPLAALLKDKRCLGIDSKKKKAEAVKLIADRMGLTNVFPYHSRIEDVLINKPTCISLKAVGRIWDMLELMNYSAPIEVFFYKGPSVYELESMDFGKVEKKWTKIEEKEILVPGTDKRILLGYKSKNVPRGTAKYLVKLSDIH